MKTVSEELRNLIHMQHPKATARWREEPNGAYTIYSRRAYMHFNHSAGFIYRHLDGKHSLDDIHQALLAEYADVPEETLLADIVKTIRAMERIGLVQRTMQETDPVEAKSCE